jgi:hypothetical protein
MRGCLLRLLILLLMFIAVSFFAKNTEYFKKQFNQAVDSAGDTLKIKESK